MNDLFELHLKNEIDEITERIKVIMKKIDELNPEPEEEKPNDNQVEITGEDNIRTEHFPR
jgi:hypothetical protein